MSKQLHTSNRARLSATIETPIIVAAHTSLQMVGDASYPFHQESNFWWLTGIEEADWQLVIQGNIATLIAPDIAAVHQTFDGSLSWEEAKTISGANEVISTKDGKALIKKLAETHGIVATIGEDPSKKYYDFAPNPGPVKLLAQLKRQFKEVEDIRLAIAKLRAIKQPEEIAAIKKAIELTQQAFGHVKDTLGGYKTEYEVEAEFDYLFRKRNALHAYEPIVAGGLNACTLHYGKNGDVLQPSSLLLIDIGASIDGYPADITRTYAIGTPTARQIAVHAAVESAHKQIIALLKPHSSVREYHEDVDRTMKRALESLGLLKQESDYRKYFPHAVSHGLGVDVHDSLGRPEFFLPGMVLTVEPGIYIPEEGIGVRIEDDILITETGNINLSSDLPTSL